MEKEKLIEFILHFSKKALKENLEKMSIESLMMIKVQIELELQQQLFN